MGFLTITLLSLALITQCANCQQRQNPVQTPVEKVPYEFLISRSNDDFTPAVSGATIALATLQHQQMDIELSFRVGRRITFSSLTDDISIDCHPVWDPKTQAIIFDSNRNQKIALWTLALSESEPKLLIESQSGMVFDAALSPDGEKLAYVSAKLPDQQWWTYYVIPPSGGQNTFAIILRDLQTQREKKIASGMFPAFSPDGEKIAYASFDGSTWNLWIKNLKTGRKTQLTKSPYNDFYPAFSPDGKWIAFVRENPANHATDIWIVKPEGGSPIQLTSTTQHNEGAPFWTQDGIYIHTDSGDNTPYDIALIPPDVLPSAQAAASQSEIDKTSITIQVLNSTRIPKLAAKTAKLLEEHGFKISDVGNTKRERNLYKGKIYYKPGLRDIAREIAEIIPGTQRLYQSEAFKYDIVIVLGRNTKYK